MKIGLIGDHITDIYIYGKMNRFSPESPIPIFDIADSESRPGGASNVNNNLMVLGAYVDYYFDDKNFSVKKRYVCDNHIIFRVDEDKTSNIDPTEIKFSRRAQEFTVRCKVLLFGNGITLVFTLQITGLRISADPDTIKKPMIVGTSVANVSFKPKRVGANIYSRIACMLSGGKWFFSGEHQCSAQRICSVYDSCGTSYDFHALDADFRKSKIVPVVPLLVFNPCSLAVK